MQCNAGSPALDALDVHLLYRRGSFWILPSLLVVWAVLCFSACDFSEFSTVWTTQRLYAEKFSQGSQEQREKERRKSHHHLFEVKERRICGTSLPRKRWDLALVGGCVAANASPTVIGRILPPLWQWRNLLLILWSSVFPLWDEERMRRAESSCSVSYGLTLEYQHHQHLLL